MVRNPTSLIKYVQKIDPKRNQKNPPGLGDPLSGARSLGGVTPGVPALDVLPKRLVPSLLPSVGEDSSLDVWARGDRLPP